MSTLTTAPSDKRIPAFLRGGARQGAFVGLVPLALLVICVAVTILLSVVALSLTGSVEFTTRQGLMVAVVVAGLLASAAVYAIACVRTLRQVKRWQRMGEAREAAAALWALAVTALIVLTPVLIAILQSRN